MKTPMLLQLGLALFLTLHLFHGALGDTLELPTYETCADGKAIDIVDTAQAVDIDADNDFLWVVSSDDVLSKRRFSDGALLASLPLNHVSKQKGK